jgi:hypothetical protein
MHSMLQIKKRLVHDNKENHIDRSSAPFHWLGSRNGACLSDYGYQTGQLSALR